MPPLRHDRPCHQTSGRSPSARRLKCNERECRRQFTVKVGTVFEHGRMPLHKMVQAVYLMCSSKKGVSAHQLHRTLEISYKSAWFLTHRIREAMRDGERTQHALKAVVGKEVWARSAAL